MVAVVRSPVCREVADPLEAGGEGFEGVGGFAVAGDSVAGEGEGFVVVGGGGGEVAGLLGEVADPCEADGEVFEGVGGCLP
ncbi:MAG: hypothetical protein IPG46_18165 [Actinobacteria bacterium]|nr:hypothetical protein [Actinomycetota bacterium]